MAETHPYSPSGGGAITATVIQLRKSFPSKISADTLKKLGIASNSESYVINTLRFLGVIDAGGNKTKEATAVFTKHNDADFQEAFSELVKKAYSELFALRGDESWELSIDDLISFFRTEDQTSALTGKRQAVTFQALAALSGHGEPLAPAKAKPVKEAKTKLAIQKEKPAPKLATKVNEMDENGGKSEPRNVGLTVRIEVNLPAAADQETYDRIFRSIRENLLNGK